MSKHLPPDELEWEEIDLPDAEIAYCPQFVPEEIADIWFDRLNDQLAWEEEEIVMFGRRRKVPRLVAWYGDEGAHYRYSGVDHDPLPWTPTLESVRESVEAVAEHPFNSVLAILYRDGSDSMGWHSDDERGLGEEPVIASVSLGAERRFRMRRKDRGGDPVSLDLQHGSLLVMGGDFQRHWHHCVPKTSKAVGPRINLTFRQVGRDGDGRR